MVGRSISNLGGRMLVNRFLTMPLLMLGRKSHLGISKANKMSRVIKFRAWDGEQMVSPDYVDRNGVGWWKENSIPTQSNQVMQFTGLHDKNGKEIYEGDIVSFTQTYIAPCAVYWNKEMTGFYPLISERSKNLTVIGNIHENPELLK